MPSCQFENLPLRQVRVRVHYDTPIPFTFPMLRAIIDNLSDPLSEVVRFRMGSSAPFSFSINDPAGCALRDPQSGLQLDAHNNQLEVIWAESRGKQYVRFAKLRDIARKAVSLIGLRHAYVVVSYVVGGKDGEQVSDFFQIHGIDQVALSGIVDLNIARRVGERGLEHRVFIPPFERAFLLETIGGIGNADDPESQFSEQVFLSDLDFVHDTMQVEFEKMLLEKAKVNYGYNGNL